LCGILQQGATKRETMPDTPETSNDPMQYATAYHAPVLVREVLDALRVGPGGVWLDGTLGGGGHTQAILEASAPNGRVYSIDRDPEAIAVATERLASYGDRWTALRGNYADARGLLDAAGVGRVDGWLVDAGVSSHQLDAPERGFSFREPGPLDMRMGEEGLTAAQWLAEQSADELGRVIADYGEMKGSFRVARAIVAARDAGELATTADLARVVESAAPRGRDTNIHPATRVFQAIRIAVNDELAGLERAVEQIPEVVRPGGRAVFISFHSLEDRIVKNGFRALASDCECPPGLPTCACDAVAQIEVVGRKPITAQPDELEENPRARSARLRAATVLEVD
jgi:16S rRNA (cytosine1402-N4)-methyltransferase